MKWLKCYDDLVEFFAGLTLPPLPSQFSGKVIKGLDFADRLSVRIGRDEIPDGFFPLKTVSDGNCFCRAISKIIFNRESDHGQVRVRLLADALKNETRYLKNEFLKISAWHGSENVNFVHNYCQYSDHFNDPLVTLTDSIVLELYRKEWFEFRLLGCYAGMFQIHSAANTFQTKLISHYPDPAWPPIYKDANRAMYPLGCTGQENLREYHILWTSANGRGRMNHFVPLFRRGV